MAVIDRLNGFGPIDTNSISNQLPGDNSDGVIYEPSSSGRATPKTLSQVKEEIAKEEAEAAKANLHSRFDGPGVAVELSKASYEAAERAKPKTILERFAETWESFKLFMLSIWTGGETQNTVEEVIPKSDTVSEPNSLTNDAESIASFMVDYGGRHLVKNSDLLTKYDKSGKIISPNPSDRRRILQGEGNINKY